MRNTFVLSLRVPKILLWIRRLFYRDPSIAREPSCQSFVVTSTFHATKLPCSNLYPSKQDDQDPYASKSNASELFTNRCFTATKFLLGKIPCNKCSTSSHVSPRPPLIPNSVDHAHPKELESGKCKHKVFDLLRR